MLDDIKVGIFGIVFVMVGHILLMREYRMKVHVSVSRLVLCELACIGCAAVVVSAYYGLLSLLGNAVGVIGIFESLIFGVSVGMTGGLLILILAYSGGMGRLSKVARRVLAARYHETPDAGQPK